MGANTVGLFLLRYKQPMNLVTYCLIKKYQIPCCLYIKFYDLTVIINQFSLLLDNPQQHYWLAIAFCPTN